MIEGTIVTVHAKEGSVGKCLEMNDDFGRLPFDPEQEAAEVLDVLLELPVETRRALALLILEHGDTFNATPRPATRSHPPVKGTGRRR